MDPSTLLSQLKDIHPPAPIGLWPLAPGWWIVIILSFVAISVSGYALLSCWRARQWKRQAKQRFSRLLNEYNKTPSRHTIIEINKLLKQTLSSARNDHRFLTLHEEKWEDALLSVKKNQSTILHNEEARILSNGIYTPTEIHLDNAMLDRITLWIRYVN